MMNAYKTSIDSDTLDAILEGATYYAAGRMTYMPSVVCNALVANKENITKSASDAIVKHIIARKNMEPINESINGLGMDFDEERWIDTIDILNANEVHAQPQNEVNAVFDDSSDFWLCLLSAFRYDSQSAEVPGLSVNEYKQLFEEKTQEGGSHKNWALNFMHDIEDIRDPYWREFSNYDENQKSYDAFYDYLKTQYETAA